MGETTADFLLERLHANGVRRIFGYPGDGINAIVGALERQSDKLEFVQVRHEETAALMACGHAKWTGEVGVCLATSGPGAIHLLNGLYDAKLDHKPVLAPVPARARERPRRGGAARDGAGRVTGRSLFPRADAYVQGPAAGDLHGAVLRDGRAARVRARVLDPDAGAAPDRVGRAHSRRGPLGPVVARVHARLQPLDGARGALRAPPPAREPGRARRRDGRERDAGRALQLQPLRQRPRERRVRQEDHRRDLGRRGHRKR